jgi:hypothetical protein
MISPERMKEMFPDKEKFNKISFWNLLTLDVISPEQFYFLHEIENDRREIQKLRTQYETVEI